MNSVDDIIINKQMPQKRKGKGFILVLFFLLLIALACLCGAYYWYTNMYETPKMAFFKYITQTNIPEIIDTDIYYNILEKTNTDSYETSTTANFTTNKKTDFTENVDVSKFEFSLNTKSNKVDEEAYIDANITYSSNDFFDLKFVSTKDSIAIGSNEVWDKYIASSKRNLSDSIEKTTSFATDIDSDIVKNKTNSIIDNRIKIDDEYKSQKISEYVNLALEKVPEEAVTLAENAPITIDGEVINANAYTLNLEAKDCEELIKAILAKTKNDKEFLNKLVTGVSEKEVEEETTEQTTNKPKPLNIQQINGEVEQHQTELTINPISLDDEDSEDDMYFYDDDMSTMMSFDSTESKEDSILVKIATAILLNQKLEMTVEELQEQISDELSNINIKDNVIITVYVKNVEGEEKETIKVIADLPKDVDLDIEYPEKDKVKITVLQDVVEKDEKGKEVTKSNGTSVTVKRTNTDMQTKFEITVNTIEQKKVVAKLQIELTTQGTKTSKTYSNNAIIKYNDNESDYKINIKNTIDFKNTKVSEELTEENAVFVDELDEEEAEELFEAVLLRLMDLYSEKILNMNFIDNNSSNGVVQQPERELNIISPEETQEEQEEDRQEDEDMPSEEQNTYEEETSQEVRELTKTEARDLLINKIGDMMADAEDHEEEFSILNLELLPQIINEYQISTEITDEEAIIKFEEYTFHIDKDFMLTEE